MSKTSVLPEYLREDMEETESKSIKTRRVKIDKGHAWLLRFVPAELGPRKQFFAKYSFHWINRVPVLCPKNTPVDFGGKGDDYECPLCEVADKLNNNSDDRISKIGYRASAVDQWLMYCVVFEKEIKGDSEPVPKSELYKPYEFWMTKTTWEDVRSEITRGYRRNEELSVMDWDNGNDFWITAQKRGFNVNREDAGPIANKDVDDVIDKIMGAIKLPQNKVPSTSDLEDKAAKIEDYAFDGDDDDDDRGSRRGRGRDHRRDDDDDDDRGSRRGGRSRSRHDDDDDDDRGSRSRRSRDDDDDRGGRSSRRSRGDDDDGGREERSSRSSRRRDDDDDGDRRGSSSRRSRRGEPEDEDDVPMDYDTQKDEGGSEVEKDDRPPSARRRGGDRPAREERERPAKAASEERPARRGSSESSVDEDDNAPEERHDPAPPEKMDEEPKRGSDEDPPEVDAEGDTGRRQSRVSDRVRRGINRRND